ncbi:MAG: alcohol dehydrogenase catalytic domain-containing protein [Chloroflexi bacterium]|nr:alcohol dehydrogenase catalytic domain-containing protein [Chloroflexota bacterium]
MLGVAKVDARPGLKLIERPVPRISEGHDVVIEVGACGICGADLLTYNSDEHQLRSLGRNGFPRVLGHEIAGTVREIGSEVTGLKEGDIVACELGPVCGTCFDCTRGQANLCQTGFDRSVPGSTRDGGYAKYVLAHYRQLVKLPQGVPFEEAAIFQPLATSVHSLERSHYKAGDSAVVIGPGPLGLLAAMLLQASGVRTLVVAGRPTSRDRLKVAAEIGARTVEINGDNLLKEVRALTEGRGADVVFDFAGGGLALTEAVKVVRRGGEIVTAGLETAGEFSPRLIVIKELTIVGAVRRAPSSWDRAVDLVANRAIDLRKIITHVLPLEEYEKAFELLRNRKALKICLVPEPGAS